MAANTRDALLEQGALLFARHGVNGVTARELHQAVGARNESALHYHFGDRNGLVTEILRVHLGEVEARRAALVAEIVSDERFDDVRELVRALAVPMAEDLRSPLGRAHLRLVAELSHPALAYGRPFRAELFGDGGAAAGAAVVKWLVRALDGLPARVRTERLAVLRGQLITLFGLRARLLDDDAAHDTPDEHELFLENLLDMLVAGLTVAPSQETLRTTSAGARRR